MTGKAALVRMARFATLALALGTPVLALSGAEVTLTQTNWVERWITNVIEVRMPLNQFVNEYRTNWVTQFQTNVVNVFATNRVTRTLTNTVVVDLVQTNFVVGYQTNRVVRMQTNYAAVNLFQTNFVDQCQTNWSVLTLTNWETVVLFRTNWVAQPATNVVQIELPPSPAPAVAAARETAAAPEPPAAAPAKAPAPALPPAAWDGPLALEVVRIARPAAQHPIEVLLKVRWTDSAAAPPPVQQWRIEREDAAILLFGQEQEFKRQLPPGKYKVEARLKAVGDDLPFSVRGILAVTSTDAVIQPRLLVQK